MKPNPDAPPIDEILKEMSSAENLPRRVGGPPETDRERAEAAEKVAEIVRNGGVRIVCVGCDETADIKESAICVCGGFVCRTCRALETEGECNHDPRVVDDEDVD